MAEPLQPPGDNPGLNRPGEAEERPLARSDRDDGIDRSLAKKERLQRVVAEMFSGPLPPPESLARYEQVLRGSADRLITMAEALNRHSMLLELNGRNAEIESMRRDYSEGRWGQICALLVALVAVIGSSYTATHGAQWPASIMGATGLGSIVATFVYGRKHGRTLDKPSQSKEELAAPPAPEKLT